MTLRPATSGDIAAMPADTVRVRNTIGAMIKSAVPNATQKR